MFHSIFGGFFNFYAKFYQNLSLRKRNVCVVSKISEQPSFEIIKALYVVFTLYKTRPKTCHYNKLYKRKHCDICGKLSNGIH